MYIMGDWVISMREAAAASPWFHNKVLYTHSVVFVVRGLEAWLYEDTLISYRASNGPGPGKIERQLYRRHQ